MISVKHLLVPTDFSDPSERALATAVELARTFKAQLTLLHVWTIPSLAYGEALSWPTADMERAAKNALAQLRERTAKDFPDVDAVLRVGKDWAQILEVAKERNADMIVMGTHGRRGLPRFVLGSVTEKIVRLSPIPVLTVSVPE